LDQDGTISQSETLSSTILTSVKRVHLEIARIVSTQQQQTQAQELTLRLA